MIWRVFRKSSSSKVDAAWWQSADAAADHPTADAIEALARAAASGTATPDELERQDEMVSGLRDLVALAAAAALPVIDTQHRVIGADRCHLIAPVSLNAEAGGAGKLFLTSARLVFVGGRVRTWPWHRMRRVTRAGRDLMVVVAGEGEDLLLQCNTYGEALMAAFIARRLSGIVL